MGLLDRLRGGEAADVVILTREGLDGLKANGSVVAASCVNLARSFVGLAVKAGADRPDISTGRAAPPRLGARLAWRIPEPRRQQQHFAQLIERMGIASARSVLPRRRDRRLDRRTAGVR